MPEQQTTANSAAAILHEQAADEEEIDLIELLYALLDKWRWLSAAAVLCAFAAAIAVFFVITPKYEATATIYVLGRSDSVINVADLNLGSALTSDYIKVFDMWEVHEQVISDLELPYTYAEMSDMLTVENTSDTRMLDITFRSASAEEAAAVANEYANVAIEYIADTMKTDKPTIMSVALVPSNPVSPQKTKIILIAALAGFVGSACVAAALFLLDDTYKNADDIKKYAGLVTLAAVPEQKNLSGAAASKSAKTRVRLPQVFGAAAKGGRK